jgi:hypothetical protein
LAWLFFALLRLSARLRAIPASCLHLTLSAHLLRMLSSHSHLVPAHLLMMLLTHLLLMMHLLIHSVLIHCMLPAVFRHLVVSFGVVAFEILLVAVKIFSFMLVSLVLPRPCVLVPVFFTTHSFSLRVMFSPHVSTCLFTFARARFPRGTNPLCALALLVALIK